MSKHKNIGERIRVTLARVDLALTYASTEYALSKKTFKLYQKFDDDISQKKTMDAYVRREAYKVYIRDLRKIKKQALDNLEECLKKYSEEKQQVWKYHFLDQYTNAQISKRMNMDAKRVYAITKQLEEDLMEGD